MAWLTTLQLCWWGGGGLSPYRTKVVDGVGRVGGLHDFSLVGGWEGRSGKGANALPRLQLSEPCGCILVLAVGSSRPGSFLLHPPATPVSGPQPHVCHVAPKWCTLPSMCCLIYLKAFHHVSHPVTQRSPLCCPASLALSSGQLAHLACPGALLLPLPPPHPQPPDAWTLQAAIAAANAEPGVVYLPAGTYRLEQPLEVTSSGVVIRGAGVSGRAGWAGWAVQPRPVVRLCRAASAPLPAGGGACA